ncbi:MAG: DUF4328 domain-containing protein [Verrucomicrobiota bacterium]
MSQTWFYATGSDKKEVSREDLESLAMAGKITAETLVWNESLSDWIPFSKSEISDALPEMVTCAHSGESRPEREMLRFGELWVAPEHREAFAQRLQEGDLDPSGNLNFRDYVYFDPAPREGLAKFGIIFSAAVSILWIVGCAIYGAYLGATDQLDQLDEDALTIWGLVIIVSLTTPGTVFYMMWVHRVVKNAHALGERMLDQTPGWAVGMHFIPIVALWKPFVIIREVYNVSHQFPRDQGHSIIGWWWACWLIYSFLSGLLPLVGIPAAVAALILAWIFMTRIGRSQRELAQIKSYETS